MATDAADARDGSAGAERDPGETDAVLARRLQILATEHWGLLAARSTAQSEVLTRITIYLTLVSAGLVTIGLLGQATHFTAWFPAAALGILGFLSVVGILTLMRVLTVSEEDFMYVTAMNRIRAGYARVDPSAAAYFLASTHDDEVGMRVTYSFFRNRSGIEQMLGSTVMISILVNATVAGMFFGGLSAVLGMPVAGAVLVGVVVGLGVVVGGVWYGGHWFFSAWRRYTPLSPTETPPSYWRMRGRPRRG